MKTIEVINFLLYCTVCSNKPCQNVRNVPSNFFSWGWPAKMANFVHAFQSAFFFFSQTWLKRTTKSESPKSKKIWYYTSYNKKNNLISFFLGTENRCTLTGGEILQNGWSGKTDSQQTRLLQWARYVWGLAALLR
jgi:hypothetical protein